MREYLCRILGHKPDRGHARFDGQNFHTHCKRCGVPLVRAQEGWIPCGPDEQQH